VISLVVITDGRDDCIVPTIAAARDHLKGQITRRLIYDDTGDALHRDWLREQFPDFVVCYAEGGRQGFGGAVRHMWAYLSKFDNNPFLFWLEDDFVLRRDVELADMATVMLERGDDLVQLVLRRQPWNPEERAAGGIVELEPDAYTDCFDGRNDWLEHRKFWSTNPHLVRMRITELGWPDDPHSEGRFGQRLLASSPDLRFGFWGARADGPWVDHIGRERVGQGY
jgi:hypothetical protein